MAENLELPRSGGDPSNAAAAPSPAFQVIVGLIMIAALLGASVFVGRHEAKAVAPAVAVASTPAPAPAAPDAPATAVAPAVAETPAPAPAPAPAVAESPAPAAASSPTPTAALAPGYQEMKSQVAELAAQLKQLQGVVDSLPRPEPALDVKPLQNKLDELARSVSAALPLVDKVNKLGERVGDIDKQIQSLDAEVLVLKQSTRTTARRSGR